ncbi:N-acetylglucosamine kinase [Kutzneria albida]|uniref:ATPase BadF/BadG/BcrA/BcrD type domain-containing protein n=1 Tax=Kutzneria albida DSM 43870 TaxID=1449976 RepID=W5W4U9_9PSEU|nr:BadF/BadG/BcrA/BcrD ATPase family protein [Kutzneria albida]AHH95795.1 hypothetical protein KALB_2427 [Kutzneria albida DSM 43870]
MRHVVGVDAGGSHTRAVLVQTSGEVLGTGRAGGANPVAHGIGNAVAQLEIALRQAIGTVPAESVSACVLGVAGGPTSGEPFLRALGELARRLGLGCACTLVSDSEVAFAAGTSAADGVLLIAGTGAVVVEIRAHRKIRHVDGDGWLLGDAGSGFWLGRQAVRAALAALDGRGAPTRLLAEVAGELVAAPTSEGLRAAAYGRPPLALARLAPLVTGAALAGDEVADRIIRRAADLLLASVGALDPVTAGHTRAVLAGGVLLAPGPLAELVTAGLADRFGLTARPAGDTALGAARLALSGVGGPVGGTRE